MKKMHSEYHPTPDPNLLTVDMGDIGMVEVRQNVSIERMTDIELKAYRTCINKEIESRENIARLSRSTVAKIIHIVGGQKTDHTE
jgi:hypothetical protein